MGVGVSCLVGATHAQNPDDQPPDSQPPGGGQAVNEPYTPKVAQQEFDEYYAAIQNCETPSLECLVRYVMRYSAIEWIGEAAGPNNVIQQEADAGFNYGTGSGAITGLFSMIGEFYKHPPAETSVYIADLVESAGFAPPAYAQGLGFASLSPILDLWKMFRNVAYFFFIGAFIVIGFMIMFRYKIAGQTAVTAQQAIPSVIISLILVTFSYAIAGLLVDLMYLTMFMMLGIFGDLLSNLPQVGGKAFESGVLSANILDVGGALFKGIWDGGLSRNVVSDSLDAVASGNNWLNRQLAIGGGIIISLIITIAVLIGVFKLFFELLKSYFSIVVAVIMSPILLMMGAIPGKNTFTPWLKGIIGNLAAFPTVLLALIMFAKFTEVGTSTGGFMPPFLIGSGAAGMIGPMLGLATILALPEIVKKVKESLGASDGGFAAAIAGAAWDRSKQGWSGKMPLGMNARNILTEGAKLPSRAVAGHGGYKYAASRAKDYGVEGRAATALKLGGALAGVKLGGDVVGHATRGTKDLMGQIRDVEIKKAAEDLKEKREQIQKEAEASTATQQRESQKNATPSGAAGRTAGINKQLEEMLS